MKIILFKPGPIGDLLHSLPVAYALKKKYPLAKITVISGFGLADILEGNPYIDERAYIPSHIFRKDLTGLVRYIREVRSLEADLFVDLKSNTRSFLIGALSGATTRLHYKKQRMVREGERRLHAIENLLETIFPVVGTQDPEDFTAYLTREDAAVADSFVDSLGLEQDRPLIALNPNVSIPDSSRHWPPGSFAMLGDRVKKELKGEVFLIGGPEDREYCEDVAARMETRPVITAGTLTLGQTGAFLKKCATLVSGDTGPMHLAAAVGTRVVALFGSMDPDRAGPYGKGHSVLIKDLPCVPCEEKTCPLGTTQCMKDISVDEVFEEVRKILASS